MVLNWIPLVLRIALGAEFIAHGYPKFKNFKQTAEWLAGTGFKPGKFWAAVLASAEFFGGIAILLGFASRVFTAFLITSMSIATLLKIFKWKVPFSKGNEAGWEWDLLILGGLITLFLLGSGNISIDSYIQWSQLIGWSLG